ncbi:MAG: preprotein translocase subunit SecE [Burkholderiales bacterium]
MQIIDKPKTFFREVYVELRKVNWLTWIEVLRYTAIVLGVTILVAAFLGSFDYLFSYLIQTFVVR